MRKETARKLADTLTWARIWSADPITIVAWLGFKWWVFGLYAAAALTDLFDGMLARRATPPPTNSDFDGKADMLFSAMTSVAAFAAFMVSKSPSLVQFGSQAAMTLTGCLIATLVILPYLFRRLLKDNKASAP